MKWFREFGALAGIVVAAVLVAMEWSRLPAVIPTHFGWSGATNGYGSRLALWSVVGLMILVYGLMTLFARSPCRFNLPVKKDHPQRRAVELEAVEMVGWLKFEVMWLFVYLVWAMIRAALNDGTGVRGWVVPVGLAMVFGTLAYYFMKMQRIAGTKN